MNSKAKSKKKNGLLPRQATGWFKGLAILMIIASHYAEWWSWFTPSEGNTELFRQGLTKLGDYGAVLFLLFSGYGLVKSLKGGRVTLKFVWKRIRTVYLPYLILMGLVQLYAGGFADLTDLGHFLAASAHWYLSVLFILYLTFMLLWAIPMPKWLRVIIFAVFTFAFSRYLYLDGRMEFWFCSNFAFPLGVVIAEYEKEIKWIADKAGWFLIPVFSLLMIPVIRSGLGLNGIPLPAEKTVNDLWRLTGAQFNWCLFAIFFSSKWPFFDPVIGFVGKISYYLYLIHTFIFMQLVNALECSFTERFLISAAATLAAGAVCWVLFDVSTSMIEKKKSGQ